MKNKSLMLILAGVLLALLLAGCGNDISTLAPEKLQLDKTPGPDWTQTAAPPGTSTPGLEGSGAGDSGQGSSEPGDSGQVRLLYFGGELTEAEESAVLEALTTLYRNMEVPDYLGEAIHMVATEEWFEVMAPGTYEGGRSYTLQQGALTLLTVQIGVDSAGVLYADIRFQDADGRLLLLKQFGTVTRLLEAAMKGNELDGAFTNWTIDSANGGIIREQGSYSGGLTVGEYTRAERVGTAGDAFDLWTHREDFKYTVTTSYFDEQGNPVSAPTAAPKPTATPKPAAQATPKPTATPKPATQATPKPTATPKPDAQATPQPTITPAPTPEPTAIPTPEPIPEPDPDEDEDDYYEPEPEPGPTPEPKPEPTPEPKPDPTPEPKPESTPEPTPGPTPKPDPEPGNDVDQEWSVDILG